MASPSIRKGKAFHPAVAVAGKGTPANPTPRQQAKPVVLDLVNPVRLRRTADERDEFPPLHSMTLSARKRRPVGSSWPIPFAVRRLMTRSNLVGCSTGRSAGCRHHPSHVGGVRANDSNR